MSSVVLAIVGIFILAIAYVTYSKLQVEKAKTAQMLALNNSVRQVQDKYKSLVSELQVAGTIDTEARRKLIMVANNYFVFQSVNAINLSHLGDLVDVFCNAINLAKQSENYDEEAFAETIGKLADALPENTREFTASYYLNVAPGLFYDFATVIDEQMNSTSTMIEENEATLDSEDSEAAETQDVKQA